jgi:hypothetical protein
MGGASLGRVKGSFVALARGANPNVDYLAPYRARVLKQHSNLRRVDVAPEDPRLPQMSNIPLEVGVPGAEVTVLPGHWVVVGWKGGRPDRPFASLWESGEQGTKPVKTTFHASTVELGGNVTPITDGVVTGQGKDPYTGLPYWMLGNSSAVVGAKK